MQEDPNDRKRKRENEENAPPSKRPGNHSAEVQEVRNQLQNIQNNIEQLEREKESIEQKYGVKVDPSEIFLNKLSFKNISGSVCHVCKTARDLTEDTKCSHATCNQCIGQCAICNAASCTECGVGLECDRCNIELWACKTPCAFRQDEDDPYIPIPCPECGFEMTLLEEIAQYSSEEDGEAGYEEEGEFLEEIEDDDFNENEEEDEDEDDEREFRTNVVNDEQEEESVDEEDEEEGELNWSEEDED